MKSSDVSFNNNSDVHIPIKIIIMDILIIWDLLNFLCIRRYPI